MINIAICEADQVLCTMLEQELEILAGELGIAIEIEVFYSGEDLFKQLLIEDHYDLLFLGIQLQDMLGLDAGQKIREELENEHLKIVYIADEETYAIESFRTRPFEFLIKPISKDRLVQVLKDVIRMLKKEKRYFACKAGKTYYKVPIEEIIYFESYDKKIDIVANDRRISFYGKLRDVEKELDYLDFLPIHQSYLIHYKHIRQLEYERVHMSNGDRLPISQSHRTCARRQYLRRMEDEK